MFTLLLTTPWFYLICSLIVIAIIGVWTWKHVEDYKRVFIEHHMPSTHICDECQRNVEHVTRTWHPDGHEILLCRGCASRQAGQRTMPQQQATQSPPPYVARRPSGRGYGVRRQMQRR